MATMVDNLRELVSPALISVVSRQTAESEAARLQGSQRSADGDRSTMASRADDQGFMNNLCGSPPQDCCRVPPLDAISALATSPAGIDTTSPIGGWLSSLFGHNLSDVTDSIARYAGISGSSAACAPLNRRAARLWDTSGAWCEATISASPAWPTCSGDNAPNSLWSLPAGFKMPGVQRAVRDGLGRPSRNGAAPAGRFRSWRCWPHSVSVD